MPDCWQRLLLLIGGGLLYIGGWLLLGVMFQLVFVSCERAKDLDLLPGASRFDLLGTAFEEMERFATLLC